MYWKHLLVKCAQRPSNTRKVLQDTSTPNTWRYKPVFLVNRAQKVSSTSTPLLSTSSLNMQMLKPDFLVKLARKLSSINKTSQYTLTLNIWKGQVKNLTVKYVSRPFKTKKVLQSMSSLYTSNANGVITKAKIKMKTWKNIIGIPTKKKLSKRKLTKLIWPTVSKRQHKNHINVAGVVTGGTNGSVLLGKIFAVSWIALIKNPIKYGHYRGIQDGHDILICSSCYNRILICDKIPNSPSYWDNRLTRSYIYNFSERAGNSYKVTFYNSTIIRITADPKPCRLCRDPVGELKDPHWSTDPTFLENKHILLLCPDPVMREPRKRILTELSSLLMEESTEPHPTLNYVSTTTTTKSLDSTTINGIFSDETVLAELFINPTSSNLPTAYRFKSYDPKYSRISALRRELYKIYCDQFNLLFTTKYKMNTTKSSS